MTQLHLALVMAIDARLLVLDEPTLGLDILYRKQFYDSLLNDYFDRSRTIVVTTHQVEEIQHVLTDVMFIDRGRIVFDLQHGRIGVALSGSDGASRQVRPPRARSSRFTSARCSAAASCCSMAVDRQQLAALGDVRTPSIADLFVAVIGKQAGGNSPHRHKERRDEYSIERRAQLIRIAVAEPRAISAAQTVYWSVRRELWENRSIYIAPLAVAACSCSVS